MKEFLFLRLAILAGLFSSGLWQAGAASVSLKANDALGTHSWAGSTNWDNGAVPAIANDYFTKNFQLRTPNPATNAAAGTNPLAFAGLSLSIDPGGSLLTKHFGNCTNSILKVNGGSIFQGDNFPVTNYGAIFLNDTKVWVMQNNATFNQNSGTAVATGPMTLPCGAQFLPKPRPQGDILMELPRGHSHGVPTHHHCDVSELLNILYSQSQTLFQNLL